MILAWLKVSQDKHVQGQQAIDTNNQTKFTSLSCYYSYCRKYLALIKYFTTIVIFHYCTKSLFKYVSSVNMSKYIDNYEFAHIC